MYHGGWGPTVDGLQKPDLLAPGIWLAAPLLPGTPTAAEVHLLHDLDACPDEELGARIRARPGASPVLDAAATLPPYLVREAVTARLADEKVICRAYKHVDGTSFAAPIVASLAAAMLEACPGLGPLELKRCLMRTARRVPGVDPSRQGFGVIRARAALHEAERLGAAAPPRSVPQP
jgi:serine protease AprX